MALGTTCNASIVLHASSLSAVMPAKTHSATTSSNGPRSGLCHENPRPGPHA